MHGAGDQFLAGSAFAENQDRAAGGGDGADGLLQLFERGTDADDVVERVARGRVAAQRKVLPAERNFRERARDREFDFVDQSRTFADVIGRAARFHRLHGRFVVIHRSHQDDRGIGRNLVRVAQDFDPIHARHLDVGNDHVESALSILRLANSPPVTVSTLWPSRRRAMSSSSQIERSSSHDENVTHATSSAPAPRPPARFRGC